MTTKQELDALETGYPAPAQPKDPRTTILEFVLWASKHKHFPLMRGDTEKNQAVPITLAAAVHLISEYYEAKLAPGVLDVIQQAKYPPLNDWEQFVRDHPAPRDDASE